MSLLKNLENLASYFKLFSIITIILSLYAAPTLAANRTQDPYETFNRHAYHLNKKVDKIVFKPLATIYKTIVPAPLKKGVSNFFSNIGEIPTIANDVLQLKPYQTLSDSWRFLINTTLGIGGLMDVSSSMNLPRHTEDLGLTFAHWGYRPSSYLVLPLFGPSTVRDAIALPINYEYLTIYPYIESVTLRNSLYALNTISQRANLLDFENVMKQAALDQYVFERNAYLQRRLYLINQDKHQEDISQLELTSSEPHP